MGRLFHEVNDDPVAWLNWCGLRLDEEVYQFWLHGGPEAWWNLGMVQCCSWKLGIKFSSKRGYLVFPQGIFTSMPKYSIFRKYVIHVFLYKSIF
jgi:hypothetical protein